MKYHKSFLWISMGFLWDSYGFLWVSIDFSRYFVDPNRSTYPVPALPRLVLLATQARIDIGHQGQGHANDAEDSATTLGTPLQGRIPPLEPKKSMEKLNFIIPHRGRLLVIYVYFKKNLMFYLFWVCYNPRKLHYS